MPGVSKENIDITLNNNELEINGRVDEGQKDDNDLKYAGYKLYNYHRKFTVGDGINGGSLTASLQDGVLTLVFPKAEKVKPKKIEVKIHH